MGVDNPLDFADIMGRDATVAGQPDRVQPELAFSLRTTNVNVGRLTAFIRVKMKTEATNS